MIIGGDEAGGLFVPARERHFQEIEPHRTPEAAEKILSGGELF